MRRLLPDPRNGVDLDEAYAWRPGPTRQVRANMVASADGGATRSGATEELSGPADKRVFAVLRGLADVILVGAGTVRIEDYGPARPTLERQERRVAAGLAPIPPLAVVSGRLDLSPESRFFTEATVRPVVVTVDAAPPERQRALRRVADVVVAGAARVEPAAMCDALAARGFARVLCEGGPQLLSTITAAGRLDELCLTVSPQLVGGSGPRILTGPVLHPAAALTVEHVLEEDGFLFLRYAVRR